MTPELIVNTITNALMMMVLLFLVLVLFWFLAA